jgi:excisionase family DNA binding protein
MAKELGLRDVSVTQGPITANASEQDTLRAIETILSEASQEENAQSHPVFIGFDEKKIELPPSVLLLIYQNLRHLLKGHAVTVVPLYKELTTQEAADLLSVSRPFLIGLLERGEIPYITTGKHRRLRFGDVIEYKSRRDATRHQALDRVAELSQEYGLDRFGD